MKCRDVPRLISTNRLVNVVKKLNVERSVFLVCSVDFHSSILPWLVMLAVVVIRFNSFQNKYWERRF